MDRLDREEIENSLSTQWIGRTLHVHGAIASTNDEALRLAKSGAAAGTVILAEEQTAGRGRRGRGWSSPPGMNLYLSVILRPSLPPQRAPELVPVVAVAGAEAMVELGVAASIKWPNDLLIRGRKVAGILTELSASSQQVLFVVAGIGINVNAVSADFPEDLKDTATSLRIETGRPMSRSLFAASFLAHLERWLERHQAEGFGAVRERYRALSGTLGRRVRLMDGDEAIEGLAEDIDDTGALFLRRDDGSLERILTGDVHTVRPVSAQRE